MDTERATAKIVEGGLYGEHAAMLEIKDPKNSAWHGFRQAVPGIPGNEYIIAGWCRLPGRAEPARYTRITTFRKATSMPIRPQ